MDTPNCADGPQSPKDADCNLYMHGPNYVPKGPLPAQPAGLEQARNAVGLKAKKRGKHFHATSKELRARGLRIQGAPR